MISLAHLFLAWEKLQEDAFDWLKAFAVLTEGEVHDQDFGREPSRLLTAMPAESSETAPKPKVIHDHASADGRTREWRMPRENRARMKTSLTHMEPM